MICMTSRCRCLFSSFFFFYIFHFGVEYKVMMTEIKKTELLTRGCADQIAYVIIYVPM